MPDHPASRSRNSRRLRILSCLSVLVLGASQASALAEAQGDLASGLLLAQDKPLEPEPQAQENSQKLFAILEEVLVATQAKLEELSSSTAILANTDLRKDVQALKQENGRLVVELEQARTRQTELERSNDEMEEIVAHSGAEAARLKAELAETRVQLGQAVGAALQAEQARQAATAEAESLRAEVEKAREELTTAGINIERFKTANTDLREQLASWHVGTRSAVAAAVHKLVLMEQKIEELNAALALTRVKVEAPSQAEHESPKDDDFSKAEAPSVATPRVAPEVADNADAHQPVDSATELSRFNW